MKRVVTAALAAAVFALAAGCGSDKPPPAPTGSGPRASDLFDKKAAPKKAIGKADPG